MLLPWGTSRRGGVWGWAGGNGEVVGQRMGVAPLSPVLVWAECPRLATQGSLWTWPPPSA